MNELKFITQYNGKRNRTRLDNFGKGKTQQQFKDDCDINKILKRYAQTGQAPAVFTQGMYGDFSDVPSYQESCEIVIKAEQQFRSLPSEIRKRFNHSPEEFLAFATNEKNIEEMRSLGLAKPKEAEPIPMKVEVINKEPEKKTENK
jgi:phage internal scaffolding protein